MVKEVPVAVYVTIASVVPTLVHSVVTALDAVAPVMAAGLDGPVTVVAATRSVAPMDSFTVVAELNVVVVKNVNECRMEPAGSTNAVPVRLALMSAEVSVTD